MEVEEGGIHTLRERLQRKQQSKANATNKRIVRICDKNIKSRGERMKLQRSRRDEKAEEEEEVV